MNTKRYAGAVERRVGRRTGKEWLLAFALLLLSIRRNTRNTAMRTKDLRPYLAGLRLFLVGFTIAAFTVEGVSVADDTKPTLERPIIAPGVWVSGFGPTDPTPI